MALTTGPRLGNPSATGFSVWFQGTDNTAIWKLEVRVAGTSTWVLAHSTTCWALNFTCVLNADNTADLVPNTKYEYRLLEDDVERASNSTFTLPTTGRFVVYQIADGHADGGAYGGNPDMYRTALEDWEANYEPDGIPAVIFQIGDLVEYDSLDTPLNHLNDTLCLTLQHADTAACIARIPMFYQHSDWDWAGNNSAHDRFPAFATLQEAYDLRELAWRDMPVPPSPEQSGYTFKVNIADVPFIMTDQRSKKIKGGGGQFTPGWTGAEEPGITNQNGATVLDQDQRNFIKAWLLEERDKGAVFYICTSTMLRPGDDQVPGITNAARDGANFYYTGEVHSIFEQLRSYPGYRDTRKLIMMTGDDHTARVADDEIGVPVALEDGQPRPAKGIGVLFREFKTGIYDDTGIQSSRYRQHFNGWEWTAIGAGEGKNILRYDITSRNGGNWVSMRATYLDRIDGHISIGTNGITEDEYPGDFYYENGTWQRYDATSTLQNQHYPPENGAPPTPFSRRRWYIDDINGTMHPEDQVKRDYYERLRYSLDIGDPDRDEILDNWDYRIEESPEEP